VARIQKLSFDMERVLIGLGSNQGDSVPICLAAIERLCKHPRVRVLKTSSFYRTAPQLFPEQPWFINGVVLCETDLRPSEMLDLIHLIEAISVATDKYAGAPGRLIWICSLWRPSSRPSGAHHPPPSASPAALCFWSPLVEIDADWVHPILKVCARELLKRIMDDGSNQRVRRVEIS